MKGASLKGCEVQPLCETHHSIKDVTAWAQEHFIKLLLVNTVCLQIIAFCCHLHFAQRQSFFWRRVEMIVSVSCFLSWTVKWSHAVVVSVDLCWCWSRNGVILIVCMFDETCGLHTQSSMINSTAHEKLFAECVLSFSAVVGINLCLIKPFLLVRERLMKALLCLTGYCRFRALAHFVSEPSSRQTCVTLSVLLWTLYRSEDDSDSAAH